GHAGDHAGGLLALRRLPRPAPPGPRLAPELAPAGRPRAAARGGPQRSTAVMGRRTALGAGTGLLLLGRLARAQVAPPPAPPPPPAAGRRRPPAPRARGRGAPAPAPAAPSTPGVPAPPQVVAELRATLGAAIQRFEARDLQGVLAHISEQYRTGP